MIAINSFYRHLKFERKQLNRIYGQDAKDDETLMLVGDDLDAIAGMKINIFRKIDLPIIADFRVEFFGESVPEVDLIVLAGYENAVVALWKAAVAMNRKYYADKGVYGRRRVDEYLFERTEVEKAMDELFDGSGGETHGDA